MRTIKKINNSLPIGNLSDSLIDLPCSGICVQAKQEADGNFTIKGIEAQRFVSNISLNLLALNIHLSSEKRFNEADYLKISRIIAQINYAASVILSSSELSRQTLNELRMMVLDFQKYFLLPTNIFVASNDDLFMPNTRPGDMIYSDSSKSNSSTEFDRLFDYAENGVFVLLDWPNNENQRNALMANHSDEIIILSKKLQTNYELINRIR